MAAGQARTRLEGHAGSVRSVAFSPDSKTLASAGFNYSRGGVSIKLWQVSAAKELASLDFTYKQVSSVHCLAFDPTGQALLSGHNGGLVKLWHWAGAKDEPLFEDKHVAVYGLKFSPDGATLAAVRSDGTLVLWDVTPAGGAK